MAMTERPGAASALYEAASTWRDEPVPRTYAYVADHPELQGKKSIVLKLAYREYLVRTQAGETLIPSTFCDHFPAFRRSLLRLINLHSWVHQKPQLAKTLEGVTWPKSDASFLGFDVIDEIGRGAFARVYLATQPDLGNRHVVLKVGPGGSSEARTLGRLIHPNIVPVYSVTHDRESQLTAICMPYLGEATLSDVLDNGALGSKMPQRATAILAVARRLARLDAIPDSAAVADLRLVRSDYIGGVVHLGVQLSEALDHAHRRGILHRDLKPSNILLAPSGRPMLLDFNLSSDAERDAVRLGGTLPYMSPEQLRVTVLRPNPEAPADARWDVFALGVIMYELLAGRLPFGDASMEELPEKSARRILDLQQRGCPALRGFNPTVPRGLARLVQQCLEVDPAWRPASAEQLATLLRKHLLPAARLQRWVRRRRLLVAAVGGAFALAGGAGVGWAATRPPLGVRKYRMGVEAFEAGKHAAAVEYFVQARDDQPRSFQVPMALGQARSSCGQYFLATRELRDALKQLKILWNSSLENPQLAEWQPEIIRCLGVTASWLTYTFARISTWTPTEYYAKMAIDQFAVHSVDIWNNRGLRALRANYLARALTYCSTAIHLDANCQPAYYNRAIACFEYCVGNKSRIAEYGPPAVADIEKAIQLGPSDGGLYQKAAEIHALCSSAPGKADRVHACIIHALDAGAPRGDVIDDVLLKPFLTQTIRDHRKTAKQPSQETDRLVVPHVHFPRMTVDTLL